MKYLVVNATFSPVEESLRSILAANDVLRRIPSSSFFTSYGEALTALEDGMPDLEGIAMSFTPLGLLSPPDKILADDRAPAEIRITAAGSDYRLAETLEDFAGAFLAVRRFSLRVPGRRLVIYSGASLNLWLWKALEKRLTAFYPGFVWLKKRSPSQDQSKIIAALAGDPLVKSDWFG